MCSRSVIMDSQTPTDEKCVKCGSGSLNDRVNARIRGSLQMVSCKECGFVEFYTPKGGEKWGNLKAALKNTGIVLLIGIGIILVLAVING